MKCSYQYITFPPVFQQRHSISSAHLISESDDEDTNDAEDPDNEDADKDGWIFVGRGCFSRVVLDEAQKAKTVRSLITKQIDAILNFRFSSVKPSHFPAVD